MTEQAPETDAALVAAYRRGSQAAARTLVDRHAQPLARFLYGLGVEPGDLEDLVQETFFRAFRRLDTWRGGGGFRSWLFAIGANLTRDRHRQQRGRVLVELRADSLTGPADPAADLVAGETELRLRQGLARLTRLQREVFLLRVQQGISYDEIALMLKTSAGAARVHYHQAVKRLKELVG